MYRGSPGSADTVKVKKKKWYIKIEIRNHFYFHKSLKGLNFEIKLKKKLKFLNINMSLKYVVKILM